MTGRNESYLDDELESSGDVEQDLKDAKSDLRRQELGKPGVGADGALSSPYVSGSSSPKNTQWLGAKHYLAATGTEIRIQTTRRGEQGVRILLDSAKTEYLELPAWHYPPGLVLLDDVQAQNPTLPLGAALRAYKP